MSQSNATNSSMETIWVIVKILYSIFYSIKSMGKTVSNWFFYQNDTFPPDEPGEIMRRIMIPESFIDKISSGWVALPFFEKATYIIGTMLVSGIVGILVSAPFLIALSAGFFSLFIHKQLISHEQARFNKAQLIAQESIELNNSLNKLKVLQEKGVALTNAVVTEIQIIKDDMQTQATALGHESDKIITENSAVVIAIGKTDETINNLSQVCENVTKVADKLHEIQGASAPCTNALARVATQLENTTGSMEAFSTSVQDFQRSQQTLSQVANRLSLFMHNFSNEKPPYSDDDDVYIAALRKENDDTEALIKRWGTRYPFSGVSCA